MTQPDLIPPSPPSDADFLRGFLSFQKQWCTRSDINKSLGWSDRRIREAAEQLGPDIVRSQAGFKLTKDLTRDDLPLAQQSIDSFISQGKRMIRSALALRKRLHSIIG